MIDDIGIEMPSVEPFDMTAAVRARLVEVHERYANTRANRGAFTAGFVAGREYGVECVEALLEALTGFADANECAEADVVIGEITLLVGMVCDELHGLSDSTPEPPEKHPDMPDLSAHRGRRSSV